MSFPENRESLLSAWLMANRVWPQAAAAYNGIHRCKLDFEDQCLTLTWQEGALENRWRIKTGRKPTKITYQTHVGKYEIAAWANWEAPQDLVLEMVYLNYAQRVRVAFIFDEKNVQVRFYEIPFGREYRTKALRTLMASWEE